MPRRTYTENEVTELLKRAAELEATRRSSSHGDDTGLTLEEIEAIAADAGLDPENLRIAAKEMERPGGVRTKSDAVVSGAEISAERWVNGVLNEEAIEEIVAELRHRHDTQVGKAWGMGDYGRSTVQTIGKSMEWQHTDVWGMYDTKVLLQPRDGKVRVRVSLQSAYGSSWESNQFWAWFLGAVIALPAIVSAAAISGSVLIGGLIGLATLGIVTPLSKRWFDKYLAKSVRKVETLTTDVVRMLGAWQPAEVPKKASEISGERLLDAIDGENVTTGSTATERQKIR